MLSAPSSREATQKIVFVCGRLRLIQYLFRPLTTGILIRTQKMNRPLRSRR